MDSYAMVGVEHALYDLGEEVLEVCRRGCSLTLRAQFLEKQKVDVEGDGLAVLPVEHLAADVDHLLGHNLPGS